MARIRDPVPPEITAVKRLWPVLPTRLNGGLIRPNPMLTPSDIAPTSTNTTHVLRSVDSAPRAGRKLLLLLLAATSVFSSGCMHRRLTIRSDPPGAAVFVDGEEIGFTPTSIDYTYYSTREITLQKAGYKTLTTPVKLSTPWYQVFPLEFVTDNFAFTKINDRREVSYALAPEQLEPRQDLENRANGLRSEALRTEMTSPGRGIQNP